MLNLDTHILLHSINGSLTSKERAVLSGDEWSISAIVLWEIAKLSQLGRIEIDLGDAELIRLLSRIHTWPINWEICRAIPRLDFKGDPADEIIAATSLVNGVALVTRDAQIRKSRIVPLV